MDDLMLVTDAAKIAHYHRDTIKYAIARGHIPTYREGRGWRKVRLSDVIAWRNRANFRTEYTPSRKTKVMVWLRDAVGTLPKRRDARRALYERCVAETGLPVTRRHWNKILRQYERKESI